MGRALLAVAVSVLLAGIVLGGCSLLRISPSIDFEASVTEGRAPLAVAFDSVVEGATSYLWSFGDGRTSSEASPVHVYTSEGIYSVMLTVEFAECSPVTLLKKRLVTVQQPLRKAGIVYLYWISEYHRSIWRGDWNGGPSEWLANEWYPPNGMDVGGGRIYWVTTTGVGAQLSVMELDGSNRRTLLSEENRLGGVAVDVKAGKVYWTCWPDSPRALFEPNREWDGALKRANLDGSDVEVLVEYPAGSSTYADQVAVDPEAGLVFWSVVGEGSAGIIRMSRTSLFDPIDLMRGVGRPRGMTLDTVPDYGARNLYFTTGDELRRVKLYWPEMTTIMTGLDSPAGIAIDSLGYRLYLGTGHGIVRANADGTDPETLFLDSGQIGSVILPR